MPKEKPYDCWQFNLLQNNPQNCIKKSSSTIILLDHWGDLGVDGWIILGWISRRWDVGIWTGLGGPRIETHGGGL